MIRSFQVGLNIAAITGFFFLIGGEANARQKCTVDRDCENYCPVNVPWCCKGSICVCGPQCQTVLEEEEQESK